jgi:hypothetical protein
MKYRKLRIAFSTVCGILCLLLLALWVRSYWVCDNVYRVSPNMVATTIGASSGTVYLVRLDNLMATGNTYEAHGWEYASDKPTEVSPKWQFTMGHLANSAVGVVNVHLPFWLIALSWAVLAMLPWLRWRFSLRTLLIAMTLIAVGLGVVIYAIR